MFHRALVLAPAAVFATFLLADHPLRADESFAFRHRPPQVGEQMTNDVEFVLDLLTSTQQDGKPVGKAVRQLRHTRQRRRITVMDAPAGVVSKVKLFYALAEQATRPEGGPDRRLPQPVSGKTYLVARVDDRLVVTDELGRTPPAEEVDIVARNMTALGRANPLSQFLNGKVLTIGQTIHLPDEMAADLLGFAEASGKATRVEMTLERVRHVYGSTLATIQTRIDGRGGKEGRMNMRVKGRLVVDVDTCRVVELSFFGPVSIFQTGGVAQASYTITAAGTLRVSMKSQSTSRPF